jgi:exodeoxyribonuclease VII small subunit
MKNPRTSPEPEIPFEEALDRLESIVSELERGELSLEALVTQYEEGVRMQKICEQRLQAAEVRLRQIQPDREGVPAFEENELETMSVESNPSRPPAKTDENW